MTTEVVEQPKEEKPVVAEEKKEDKPPAKEPMPAPTLTDDTDSDDEVPELEEVDPATAQAQSQVTGCCDL